MVTSVPESSLCGVTLLTDSAMAGGLDVRCQKDTVSNALETLITLVRAAKPLECNLSSFLLDVNLMEADGAKPIA